MTGEEGAAPQPASEPPANQDLGPGSPPAEIIAACDALGTLWATFQLYPEPQSQPIFTRASEDLRSLPFFPFLLDVGPGVMQWHRQDLDVRREGVERLAKTLFVHDVAAVHMVGPPSVDELMTFFRVAAADEEIVRATGGPRAALAAQGVRSIELIGRALLAEPDEFEESGGVREAELAALLDVADDPESLAAELLDAGVSPSAVAALFVERYLRACDLIDDIDHAARETIVRFFVEAVFYLPKAHQGELLGALLSGRDEAPVQVLLDQFAGHDLAELSTALDPGGMQRLYEYARLATDSADGRPQELLALLQAAPVVEEARRAVAERVEHVIAASVEAVAAAGEAFDHLREQVPQRLDDPEIGTTLLRRMIRVEDRELRLRRVLRIWTGRVAAMIRDGDLETARLWLLAVLDDPPYGPEHQGEVRQALVDLASPHLLDSLVTQLADTADPEMAERLLGAWGPTVTERLVEQLAGEEQPGKRRVLMDFLVILGKLDPVPLVAFLRDERWFVVRNLAVILGRTGRSETGPKLLPLMEHPDHRVRVEVLRALVPLLGNDVTAALFGGLTDPHPRVRQAALTLLKVSPDPAADGLLGEALSSSKVSPEEKERIVMVLAGRAQPDGVAVLERFAARRIVVTTPQKIVRDAARQALRRAS